jgi:cell volume regulation protein A
MLFLVMLGLLVGPILGVIRAQDIAPLTPFLSILAVVIILFDGGLGLDIPKAVAQTPRAVILAVGGFALSVAFVTVFARFLLGWRLLQGALLGAMLGGSSSIVVIALVKRMGLSEKCNTTLVLESSMTDILCIIGSIALIEIMTTGLPPIQALASEMTARFTTGIVLGGVVGFVWLNVLPKLSQEPYKYMVTLALIFITYFASESLGGSGAISALVFGLMLANSESILAFFKRSSSPVADESFRTLEAEIVFLVKAFFFVYLGLIVAFPTLDLIILALAISLLLLGARSLAVLTSTLQSELANEREAMTVVYGRGLAAAILSVLPAQFGIPNAGLYTSLTLLAIVFTAIITSVGATMYKSRRVSSA